MSKKGKIKSITRTKMIKCCDTGYKNKRCNFCLCKECCIKTNGNKKCKIHSKTNVKLYDSKKEYNTKFNNVLDNIKADINNTMKLMQSSDFDRRSGLNEAGFKLLILGIITKTIGFDRVVYLSEYPVPSNNLNMKRDVKNEEKYLDPIRGSIKHNKFIDIYIETPFEIILIEIKYVRLPWIGGVLTKEKSAELRINLSKKKEIIDKMTVHELLDKKSYSGNKLKKILETTNSKQLSEYIKLISLELKDKKKSKKKIKGYVYRSN